MNMHRRYILGTGSSAPLAIGVALVFSLCASLAVAQDDTSVSTPQIPTSEQAGAIAQTATAPSRLAVSNVLVFDRSRVLRESMQAQDLNQSYDLSSKALSAENDAIYADLASEEQVLADIRDATDPEEFQLLADAFDKKVVETRVERAEKAQDVKASFDTGIQEIESLMNAVLTSVARARSAVLVFERGDVYLMSETVDITDMVILGMAQMHAREAAKTALTPAANSPDKTTDTKENAPSE